MPLHRFVLHNHRIREAGEAVLAPGQVGLLAGWGVFSTIRVSEGVLFAFERHWARMLRDADRMHVPMPFAEADVRRRLSELVEANRAPHCTLRLVVVRNGGGPWEGPPKDAGSDLVALTADTKSWGAGVRLAVQPDARHSANEFSGAKILSWAMNLTWLENAQHRGFDEVILLNERGEVAECTSANIFIVRDAQVFTPPLSSGCLPGITRELLLSEVRAPGCETIEKTLMPGDFENADEVFITSTTRDLLPVLSIEGRPMKNLGYVRPLLQASLCRYADEYIAAHQDKSVTA